MKKTLYLFLTIFCFAFCANRSGAQTITTHSQILDTGYCGLTNFYVNVAGCTSGLTMTAWYGDGSNITGPVYCSGSTGSAYFSHTYSSAGSYSIMFVLFNGTTPLDTVEYTYSHPYCANLPLVNYFDANSNCAFDAGDEYIYTECAIEVDSAGVPIDTLSILAGGYYAAYGPPGTAYQFKVLTAPAGFSLSCPSSGIITYLVPAPGSTVTTQLFGYSCVSPGTIDLSLYAQFRAAITGARAYGCVFNTNCNPTAATVKINFSPKYTFASMSPAFPYTISGNSITINIGTVSSLDPVCYHVNFNPVGTIAMGDTVHSTQTVYPVADADPSNNSVSRIDTIVASLDPNQKSVLPTGDIAAGAQLQYMLEFENTGNGTAYNIHIMDTLSNYLDVNTLKVISSSHASTVIKYVSGGQNIVKFDFPNINLADSSHHDANKGMVVFSIKAKSTLTPGTVIPNRGGIYFDTNPVVMTNTAYSKIPVPVIGGVATVNSKEVLIYPNPVKSTLSFVVDPGTYSSLSITNVLGQRVLSQDFSTNVNVSNLPSGIYYITLKGNNDVTTMKFEKL